MRQEQSEPQQRTLRAKFTQQRLRSWQPILAPRWIISIYIFLGLLFLCSGVVLLLTSWSVVEVVYDYTEEPTRGGSRVGYFDMHITSDMEPPIWIYYQLDGFHQNHRRYVKSRDDKQLWQSVNPRITARDLPSCKPAVTSGDGRVLYPCGLVARSVFNDSYVLVVNHSDGQNGEVLYVDSSAETIAWSADTDGKFRNLDPMQASTLEHGLRNYLALDMWLTERFPPEVCEQIEVSDQRPHEPVRVAMRTETLPSGTKVEVADCTWTTGSAHCNFVRGVVPFACDGNYRRVAKGQDWGVQSGHFIVWMRIAGLPSFRKLWGKVVTPLREGSTLRVHFQDNFPVSQYRGRKAFVISTSSALGGRNDFLGYGYMVVGSCCLIFGVVFLCRYSWHGLRLQGDPTLLGQPDR